MRRELQMYLSSTSNTQGQDLAGPLFSWARGFLVGFLLSAAIVADMLGYGWNAFAL
jgi:hypothetical protein